MTTIDAPHRSRVKVWTPGSTPARADKPLIAGFGGIPPKRQKYTVLTDRARNPTPPGWRVAAIVGLLGTGLRARVADHGRSQAVRRRPSTSASRRRVLTPFWEVLMVMIECAVIGYDSASPLRGEFSEFRSVCDVLCQVVNLATMSRSRSAVWASSRADRAVESAPVVVRFASWVTELTPAAIRSAPAATSLIP